MSEIACTCPHCGEDLNVDSEFAGQAVKCPSCSGEFAVPDVDTATIALMGALNMVGMMNIVRTGSLDADSVADALVPQLLEGICAK